MKAVSEVRALQYLLLEASDLAGGHADDNEQIDDAIATLATIVTETSQNIGIPLVTEDGQTYRIIVFKEAE